MKSLKYQTAKEAKGTAVKLKMDISNRGGETFKAGEIMYIVDKWKGWTLSRQVDGGWAIRCVSERQFVICPTKHAPDVVDSAPLEALPTPEVNPVGEADTTPATTQVM